MAYDMDKLELIIKKFKIV